jgi:hypothetical protein
MKPGQGTPSVDLRAFRWTLQPAERRLDAQVETARLALARLYQQSRALEQAERRRGAQQREQEGLALQQAQRDVVAGAQAMRYLARLGAERLAADAVRAGVQQRLELARDACAERQRQLESVQALRRAAEREHTQACLRRAARDADAAWLALVELRRAAQQRQAGEAE